MAHGHDIHFLERLKRLSRPETELALGLYRDPALIRVILEHVQIDAGAERAAISLGDDRRGPFVVVARDGHFVTCLGEGMSPGDHPVVTRAQLDGVAARVATLRARLDSARDLIGEKGGIFPLVDRLFTAGPWLSREEFAAIAAFQPLLKQDFLTLLLALNNAIDGVRKRALKRRGDLLRPAWNALFALQHLSVLVTMDSREDFEEPPISPELPGILSWPTVRQGVVAIALRGIWGVAQVGKPLLPAYKSWLVRSETSLELLDSMLGLSAIGLRRSRLRAEVRKALSRVDGGDDADGAVSEKMRSARPMFLELCDLAFDREEECSRLQLEIGRSFFTPKTPDVRPEDLPDEVARLMAASWHGSFVEGTQGLLVLFACLPWLARAKPEDLYWPSESLEMMRSPWNADHAALVLAPGLVANPSPQPAQAEENPGRNEPCPCGSGKKWKRCHGRGP